MARKRTNFVSGTLSIQLLAAGTTMNSNGLADLEAIAGPHVAIVILDPLQEFGEPEIVFVTVHTAAAISATITRGEEGTTARDHPAGTTWKHGPVDYDWTETFPEYTEAEIALMTDRPVGTTVFQTDLVPGVVVKRGVGADWRHENGKVMDVVFHFGADPTGVTLATTKILDAIEALRANAVSILDTSGGSTITAYSSGIVFFPPGVFAIDPDALLLSQDLGLTLRGSGSRRTNNAVRAPTTLLIKGTSSGFGIQAYRSGGRGLTIEDMDICYEVAGFTGDVLDVLDCPGVTLNRVFLGTFGLTGGTRLQTARSCIRSTYDEFLTANNCVFDGAVDGWYSDDSRTALGNTFGGSMTSFNECVWYDFTGDMVRHDGNRTRQGVSLRDCTWNPIGVDCVRAVDLNNVDGLGVSTSLFAGSTTHKASTEWLRLVNCTGSVRDTDFNDLSPAGTLDGALDVVGNRVFCTNGFTLIGGIITGRANEFGQGTNGWTLSPTRTLVVDLGPDEFKAAVSGRSYDIPADSVNLGGHIHYDSAKDSSTSKFRNTSGRVRIENVDGKIFSVSTTPVTVSILDTGRTLNASGGAGQVFTLPTPTPGTRLSFVKTSAQTLTINCAGGTNFYTGTGAVKSAVDAAGVDVGGCIELEAFATVGWFVRSLVGTWVFS